MFEMKKNIGGKIYNMGFTTGTCAAAASKAAVIGLLYGNIPKFVNIDVPAGFCIEIDIVNAHVGNDFAECSVIKQSGDDPDVTDGIEIASRVSYFEGNIVVVEGGEGVGVVTQKGLKVAVGNAAINPVPLSMIKKEVLALTEKGIKIVISVPKGKEIAKKTFNERLGIEDGISIIGTKGIVTPMSEEAWKDAILSELEVKKAMGFKSLCFVFGRTGEDFAVQFLKIPSKKIVIVSNFVGYMLDAAVNMGFLNILILGHTGKIIKLASGNFHTHSSMSDSRMETLCTLCALMGADKDIIKEIYDCKTTDAAHEIIENKGFLSVYKNAAEIAENRCMQRIHEGAEIGILFFNGSFRILAKSKKSYNIINTLRNDLC